MGTLQRRNYERYLRQSFVVFVMVTSLSAKGTTTISRANLRLPIDITGDSIIKNFQVSGPGVFHGCGGVVTEETEGFIIDWPSGVVAQRPSGASAIRGVVLYDRHPLSRPEAND